MENFSILIINLVVSMATMGTNCKEERRTFSTIMLATTFVIFTKAESDAKMVEGCAFSTMNLTCNEREVINITSVVLGDSPRCDDAKCCPRHDHCTAKPNDNHVNEVQRRCNGQLTCTVAVIRERIPCESSYYFFNHNNDFERITYICTDNETASTPEIHKTTENERDSKSTGGNTESFTTDSRTQIGLSVPLSSFQVAFVRVSTRKILRTAENKRDTKSTGGTIESFTTDSNTQIATFAMPEKTMSTFTIAMSCAMACLVVLVIVLIFILLKRKTQMKANSNPTELSGVSRGFSNATYEEIATSDVRTYEEFVQSGTEDFDTHAYAGLVTQNLIEIPTYLELI